MKTFTVGANDSGQRLDRFMRKTMPAASSGVIYKALRKKRVKINGRAVTDGSVRLERGCTVDMYINDEFFGKKEIPFWMKTEPKLSVVYEDGHIIIMDKPSGMLSQAEGGTDSLEGNMRAYLYKNGELDAEGTFIPSLCHRIDRNTSGLVIGAKDAESLRILNQKIKDKEIRKLYLCRTEGVPVPKSGEIKGWLTKDKNGRKMIFSERYTEGAAECRTIYKTLSEGSEALVEAELLSGRTHQIRASLAHIGCPISGDVKYGAAKNGKREFQQLRAYKLIFSFSTDAGILEYLRGKEITV